MECKTEMENLNSKYQENIEQLENKIINYNDLQKLLKSSSEEKNESRSRKNNK